MKLKVLEYAQTSLPKLFESIDFDNKGNVFLGRPYMSDPNLSHDSTVISKYICELKEISDCDTIINEFKQIDELLKAAKLKGMNLLYTAIFDEKKKIDKCQSGKIIDTFVNRNNIEELEYWKKRIQMNYDDYIIKNVGLWEHAIEKRNKIALEDDVYELVSKEDGYELVSKEDGYELISKEDWYEIIFKNDRRMKGLNNN